MRCFLVGWFGEEGRGEWEEALAVLVKCETGGGLRRELPRQEERRISPGIDYFSK
jgi:hypothetical protein